ncbi:hypothetical protein [Pseudoxanthomonas japonensis]|uniref:hypothetical protein n=1 Tax=Pseudoxanthomonas japonensis TaxID=69284 RepID=UPI0037489087
MTVHLLQVLGVASLIPTFGHDPCPTLTCSRQRPRARSRYASIEHLATPSFAQASKPMTEENDWQ